MRMAAVVLLALGITQIVGCASRSKYVELPYPPKKQVEVDLHDAKPITSGPRTHNVILTVNDIRETRDRIGSVISTFGIETASFLTEDNIEIWVYDAIKLELERLGYQVPDKRSAMTNMLADRLTIDVQKVYCETYLVYDGEVFLQAMLERAGEEPIAAAYPSRVNSGLFFRVSARATGESLAQALQTAIREMLHDLGFQ